MDNELIKAFNNQLTLERTNAAVYDALSAALENVYWPGAAAWMKKAANDERTHADKFSAHLIDRGAAPVFNWLPMAETPAGDDLATFFEAALAREKITTAAIVALYHQSEQAGDPQACVFLHWFLEEQTQSERDIVDILIMLKRLDNNGRVVFDAELKD